MAVQFSPKILGLNVENFETVFGHSGTEFTGLFFDSPELNLQNYFR